MENKQVNRKFGLITGAATLLIFAYQVFFEHHGAIYLGIISASLLLLAVISPQVLNPARIVWDKIGLVMATVNTGIILFLVFFLMVTPLGYLLRLLKKTCWILSGTITKPLIGSR